MFVPCNVTLIICNYTDPNPQAQKLCEVTKRMKGGERAREKDEGREKAKERGRVGESKKNEMLKGMRGEGKEGRE